MWNKLSILLIVILFNLTSCIFQSGGSSESQQNNPPKPPEPDQEKILLSKIIDFSKNNNVNYAQINSNNTLRFYLNTSIANQLKISSFNIKYGLKCGNNNATPSSGSGVFTLDKASNVQKSINFTYSKPENCKIQMTVNDVDIPNDINIGFANRDASFDDEEADKVKTIGVDYKITLNLKTDSITDNFKLQLLPSAGICITSINNHQVLKAQGECIINPICPLTSSVKSCLISYRVNSSESEKIFIDATSQEKTLYNIGINASYTANYCVKENALIINSGNIIVTPNADIEVLYCPFKEDKDKAVNLSVSVDHVSPENATQEAVGDLKLYNDKAEDVTKNGLTLNVLRTTTFKISSSAIRWNTIEGKFLIKDQLGNVINTVPQKVINSKTAPYAIFYKNNLDTQEMTANIILNDTIKTEDGFIMKSYNVSQGSDKTSGKLFVEGCVTTDGVESCTYKNISQMGLTIKYNGIQVQAPNNDNNPLVLDEGAVGEISVSINPQDQNSSDVKLRFGMMRNSVAFPLGKDVKLIFLKSVIDFIPNERTIIPGHNHDDFDLNIKSWQDDYFHENAFYFKVKPNAEFVKQYPNGLNVRIGVPKDYNSSDISIRMYRVNDYAVKNGGVVTDVKQNYDSGKLCSPITDQSVPFAQSNCRCSIGAVEPPLVSEKCIFKVFARGASEGKSLPLVAYDEQGNEIFSNRMLITPLHETEDVVISVKNVKGFVAPDGKGDLFSTVIGFNIDFMKNINRSGDEFQTINAIDHDPDYLSECDSQGGLRDQAIRVGNACMNYNVNTLNNMKNRDFNELNEDNLKNGTIFSNNTFIYQNDNSSATDYKRLSPIKYKDQVIKIYNFDKKNLLGAKTDGLDKVSVPKMTVFQMIPRSWDSGNNKLRADYLQGYSVNININIMRKAFLFQDQDINYYSSNQQGVGKCKLSNHPAFSPILSTTNFDNLPESLKMNLNDCTVKIQGKTLQAEHILPLNSKQKIYTYNFGDGFWTSYNHSGEYQGNSFWGYYYTDVNSTSFSTDEAKGWGNDHAGVWAADGNGGGNWEVWDSAWNLLSHVDFGAVTMATQPLNTTNPGTSKICLWGTGSQWTENNNVLNELAAHPNGDC